MDIGEPSKNISVQDFIRIIWAGKFIIASFSLCFLFLSVGIDAFMNKNRVNDSFGSTIYLGINERHYIGSPGLLDIYASNFYSNENFIEWKTQAGTSSLQYEQILRIQREGNLEYLAKPSLPDVKLMYGKCQFFRKCLRIITKSPKEEYAQQAFNYAKFISNKVSQQTEKILQKALSTSSQASSIHGSIKRAEIEESFVLFGKGEQLFVVLPPEKNIRKVSSDFLSKNKLTGNAQITVLGFFVGLIFVWSKHLLRVG